ncbi:unnamed protein product [Protopolystoma xenopodis]|uniref:Innexin n=1 Tax=Protopolystoma xenopodis TaxID=117903 RepID=A0A448WMM2_9PLAT|nr:unnamed protein product [Protopolystoma xenopodis]
MEQRREYRTGKFAQVRRNAYKWCSMFAVSKRLGNRLAYTYLFIKLLYVFNAISQLFLMQAFLGLRNNSNYTIFGVAVLNNMLSGHDWQTTMIFPRVCFCRAPLLHLSGWNNIVTQCVLPVNMLNERIFVFLWFWILLAAIITTISVPIWFFRIHYEKSRTSFVKRFLKLGEQLTKKDKCMVEKFSRQFLRHDGVFLLRMISMNAGELVASEIVCQLWTIYKLKYYNRDFSNDHHDFSDLGHVSTVRLEDGGTSMISKSGGPNSTLIQRYASQPTPSAPIGDDDAASCRKL